MQCFYNNCSRKATKELLTQPLCIYHYMLVKEEFTKTDGKGQGNFKLEKIKFLIDYFEEKKTFTSTLPQLEVSYPTMQKYLTKLESYGFIKKVGKSYRMV